MSNARILIVDDEPHIVEMLKMRLEANDYQVEDAQSGRDAISLMDDNKDFDAIMTDIMMPGMDGIELLQNIKEINSNIEVIIITGFASLNTAIEAVRLGAYDYIKKPFEDMPKLLHTVKSAVEKKRLVIENKKLTEDLKLANENLKKINIVLGDNLDEMIMLINCISTEIKEAQKKRGNFSLVGIKILGELNKEEIVNLREKIDKKLPSEEDKIGLYSDELILLILKRVDKSLASKQVDGIVKGLSKNTRDNIEVTVLTFPEDGSSTKELINKL